MSKNHCKYLLANKLPTEYFCQVQMSLYVTEREKWFFVSHYPGMRPLFLEVFRNDEWIEKLDLELTRFNDELLELVDKLK
jgi:predicted phage-related endonuclease